jgi:predicted RNA-binding protein YlqC (UPF0109 family)
MSEIDQQFIEYVVKSLVGKPDAVQIERRIDEKGVLLELTVDPEDLGRVIGKRGATAQSLRTLLRALGTKNDARYNLKIIDNGPLDKGRGSDTNDSPRDDKPADDQSVPADDEVVGGEDAAPAESEEPAAADSPSEEPEEAPAPEAPEPPAAEPEQPSTTSDEDAAANRLAQTRKELADLDDLDV